MKTPKLIKLDMRKSNKHEHPDIDLDKTYMCSIDGRFYVGQFDRQWYGLNFSWPWSGVGKQFDAPGFNSSKWEQIWEVRKVEETVKAKEKPAQIREIKVCPSCNRPVATDYQWRSWAGWEGYHDPDYYQESDYCLDKEYCGK